GPRPRADRGHETERSATHAPAVPCKRPRSRVHARCRREPSIPPLSGLRKCISPKLTKGHSPGLPAQSEDSARIWPSLCSQYPHLDGARVLTVRSTACTIVRSSEAK